MCTSHRECVYTRDVPPPVLSQLREKDAAAREREVSAARAEGGDPRQAPLVLRTRIQDLEKEVCNTRPRLSLQSRPDVLLSSGIICLLISFRKSTPPQNRHLDVLNSNSEQ